MKKIGISILRIAIGWHFLYEGFSKLFVESWSARGFLENASGPFSKFYHFLGSSDILLSVINPLNIAGLILIGLGLFLGLALRVSKLSGILLLLLYYLAYPPFGGGLQTAMEGNFFVVNRNLLEACMLFVLYLLDEKGYGLYALLGRRGSVKENIHASGSRREALKHLAAVPALGIFGLGAIQETRKYGIDTLSGASVQVGEVDLNNLEGELPKGKLGEHEISRLVAGGNLIGGWAHSRDLRYVSSLFRAYNTERKIFETLQLAEKAGINCINIGFVTNDTMRKYKDLTGSKIKVISQVHPDMKNKDYFVNIDKAIDFGVDIVQIQGNHCDWLVRDSKLDVIQKMLERIRTQGYTAGLASHSVESLIACEEVGIIPDYYMKTMHHDNYWSAHPREFRRPFEVDGRRHLDHNRFHDNIFCLDPDLTVDFVNRATVPVMGFKVLAAGAISPEDGFKWAFENGADFICVGMFDFQIVKDVNVTIDVLKNLEGREREWYA